MKKITIITIVLFSVGIACGSIIVYNYLTSHHLITREQAYAIAVASRKPYQDFTINRTVNIHLVHAKSLGISYVVDEETLKDYSPTSSFLSKTDQYAWLVSVSGYDQKSRGYESWGFVINATDGKILKK